MFSCAIIRGYSGKVFTSPWPRPDSRRSCGACLPSLPSSLRKRRPRVSRTEKREGSTLLWDGSFRMDNPNHREFLLVELKRPSLVLAGRSSNQLEDYVNALLAQPDFINPSTNWNFYLVSQRVQRRRKGAGLRRKIERRPIHRQAQSTRFGLNHGQSSFATAKAG